PGGRYARHAYGEPAPVRDRFISAPANFLWCEASRRTPGAIQSMKPVPVPDQHKEVPTCITADRLYDSQGDRGRHGRVHRVPSPFENRESRLRGQVLARRNDSIAGKKWLPVRSGLIESGKIKAHRHSSERGLQTALSSFLSWKILIFQQGLPLRDIPEVSALQDTGSFWGPRTGSCQKEDEGRPIES